MLQLPCPAHNHSFLALARDILELPSPPHLHHNHGRHPGQAVFEELQVIIPRTTVLILISLFILAHSGLVNQTVIGIAIVVLAVTGQELMKRARRGKKSYPNGALGSRESWGFG